jgi:hypothetical protein
MTRQVNRSRRKTKTSLGPLAQLPFTTTRRAAGFIGGADAQAVDVLRLYAENESQLYNQKVSILKNVARRLKNGTYDAALAPKLWMYWVDNAARMYEKKFGTPGSKIFDRATREHLAHELANDMLSEAREYMT